MNTLLLSSSAEDIKKAAEIIRHGGLVAFPTETVYGLGANALDGAAVRNIFAAKGRPSDNPLIVHIAKKETVYDLAKNISAEAQLLMNTCWPGPLTLVLEKKNVVPDEVTCNLNTVAVRMPRHDVARALILAANVPIAAPSANVSGKPSTTSANHVFADLHGKIDAIIDGGIADIGVESTVVDVTSKPAMLLRPGGVTFEQLEKILGIGNITLYKKNGNKKIIAKSPGMKYRHYAPKAPVILVEGNGNTVYRKITELVTKYSNEGKQVGVITQHATAAFCSDAQCVIAKTPHELAQKLFSTLRDFDEQKKDIIIVEGVEEKGMGLAVMNRIRKAAKEIITV